MVYIGVLRVKIPKIKMTYDLEVNKTTLRAYIYR